MKKLFGFIKIDDHPIIERVKTPFIFTYIIVWCLWNWKLLISLVFLPSNATGNSVIAIIEVYYDVNNFWCNMGKVLLLTITTLIISYIGINIGRIITVLSEYNIQPIILDKIASKLTVPVERFNYLNNKSREFETRLEEEVKLRRKIESKRDELETEKGDISIAYEKLIAQMEKEMPNVLIALDKLRELNLQEEYLELIEGKRNKTGNIQHFKSPILLLLERNKKFHPTETGLVLYRMLGGEHVGIRPAKASWYD